jgi:carbon storage regulator
MLVLSRKVGEQIVIGDNIVLTVVEVRGEKVRLGITAPKDVVVHRMEIAEQAKATSNPAASNHQTAR